MHVFRLKQCLTTKASENLASPAPRLVPTIQHGSPSSRLIVKTLQTREEGTTEKQIASWAAFRGRSWVPRKEHVLVMFSNLSLQPQKTPRQDTSLAPEEEQVSRKQLPRQRPSGLPPRQLAISSQSPHHTQAGWILTKTVKINLKNLFVCVLLRASSSSYSFPKQQAFCQEGSPHRRADAEIEAARQERYYGGTL